MKNFKTPGQLTAGQMTDGKVIIVETTGPGKLFTLAKN